MFKSLKGKTIALGFCCLAFAFSGSARASVIDVDCGKYGKHFDQSCKDLDLCKFQDCKFDLKDLLKDLKDCKDDKGKGDDKVCKDDKGKGDDKDGKDKDQKCKIDWGKDCDHKDICYGDDKKCDDKCDIVDCDHHNVCDPHPCDPHPCDPHAVPAPAASLMSGFGVICVGMMGWLKNRRSVKA
jgi:hypothetical protein